MKNKEITKKEIINGLLKEALFLDIDVDFLIEKIKVRGKMIDLSTENDQIMLFFENQFEQSSGTEISVVFNFEKFQISFLTSNLSGTSPFYMIQTPEKLQIVNNRSNKRFNSEVKSFSRVTLDSEEESQICKFKIQNVSFNGVGGELVTKLEESKIKNSRINGSIFFKGSLA